MNNVARLLLIVGAVVLALLIGLVIGRGQRAEPTAGNTQAVQITTAPPPAPPPPLPMPPPPPPTPVEAPKPPQIPQVASDEQVQEDAAAVGMTTREEVPPGVPTSTAGSDNPEPETTAPPAG